MSLFSVDQYPLTKLFSTKQIQKNENNIFIDLHTIPNSNRVAKVTLLVVLSKQNTLSICPLWFWFTSEIKEKANKTEARVALLFEKCIQMKTSKCMPSFNSIIPSVKMQQQTVLSTNFYGTCDENEFNKKYMGFKSN